MRAPQLRLLALFSRRRAAQFVGVLALTLAGAVAELVSIGAVIPFMQLVAAPDALLRVPAAVTAMRWLGVAQPADLLIPAAILLTVAAIVSGGIRVALTWVSSRYVAGLVHDLSMRVYDRIIRQPYSLYVQRNSAELLASIEKVHHTGLFLLTPGLTALSSAIIAAGIIGLLVYVDPLVAALAGGSVAVVYLLLGLVTRTMLLGIGRRQAALSTERIKVMQEGLGGIRDIILDRSHDVFSWQYRVIDARLRRSLAVTTFISVAPRYVVEGAGIIMIAGCALYFAGQPGGVVAALPVLGALALGAQRLIPLAQNINLAFVQYAHSTGTTEDVLGLVEAPALIPPPRLAPGTATPLAQAIELRGVDFAYEPSVPTLRGIDLTIPRGTRVGFVGQTGSGKSTVLDLVMGLLEPTAGGIYVDGVKLDARTTPDWQATVAHVPQTIFLLDHTIAANIAFGVTAADIDMTRVRDVARRAEIAAFVESLPDGYDTRVGERGVRLSGGQRQRLGIARALYKHASVLILDEATSALDDATERAVMAGIDALDRDLTILMIAHRLSTVASCDLVVRLDQGRIVGQGSYHEVIAGNRLPVA